MLLAVSGSACAAAAQADGLSRALRAALRHHPSIAALRAEVRSGEASAEVARAQRYPNLSVQAQQAGRLRDSAYSPGLATVRVRQPLWAFGRIDDSIGMADADTRVRRITLLKQQRQMIEDTAVAYSRAVTAELRLQVSRDNYGAHQQWLQQIQRREQGQLASLADVRLALARVADARAQLERSESELMVAREELAAITFEPAENDLALDPASLEGFDLERALAQAMKEGADIRLREQQISAAQSAVAGARSSAMPTVYLQAEHFVNAGALYQPSPRYAVVLEGGLDGLGLATRGRVEAANAALDAAHQELRHAQADASRRLRSWWHGLDTALRVLRDQQESVDGLADVLASYRRQYEAGTKTWLEVLNMQRELSERRSQLAQARGDAMTLALRAKALTAGLDAEAGLEPENE